MQLRERAVLQEAAGKRVSVVEGDRGERLVLKRYAAPTRATRLARAFLRAAAEQPLESLEVPRLVDDGDDFLLTGYVEREQQTRDTILERAWTRDDVRLWVRGLFEFQALPLPARLFTLRQRVLGWLYPVFRAAALWRDLPRRGAAAALMARYLLARPFFRNVAAHYDLQTYNYAFRVGARRMSLLDFEFSYCRGDPLFDLLYFVTIPVARLDEWTFQRDLVREFLAQWRGEPRRPADARAADPARVQRRPRARAGRDSVPRQPRAALRRPALRALVEIALGKPQRRRNAESGAAHGHPSGFPR